MVTYPRESLLRRDRPHILNSRLFGSVTPRTQQPTLRPSAAPGKRVPFAAPGTTSKLPLDTKRLRSRTSQSAVGRRDYERVSAVGEAPEFAGCRVNVMCADAKARGGQRSCVTFVCHSCIIELKCFAAIHVEYSRLATWEDAHVVLEPLWANRSRRTRARRGAYGLHDLFSFARGARDGSALYFDPGPP